MEQQAQTQASEGKGAAISLADGRGGIIGVKAGMTQVYDAEGDSFAVTVIDLRPNFVTQVKTKAKEGYNAVQIGMLEKKSKKLSKAEQGHFKKSGQEGFYHVKEIRLPENAKMDGLTAGATLTAAFIKEGDLIDLSSRSKGKGYQGGMKRYHMSGNYKSHGASLSHRSLGSIGNRADPAKCFKNKKMPGQMGNENVTVQNVRVIKIDADNGLLLVHGSVPGPKSGIVMIRKAVKSVAKK